MLTDQELFEGKGIVLLIDGIAVVVVGFEDSIDGKEDFWGNDRFVFALNDLTFQ